MIKVVVTLCRPDCFNEDMWKSLYDGQNLRMVFDDLNGCVELNSTDGIVTFLVTKQGNCETHISISVPLTDCKAALQTYLDFLATSH